MSVHPLACFVISPIQSGFHRIRWSVHLPKNGELTGIDARDIVSIRTLTLRMVHLWEILKPAILLNVCASLVVHNHPFGDPMPRIGRLSHSCERGETSWESGSLLDQLILGDDRLYSFADQGCPL